VASTTSPSRSRREVGPPEGQVRAS
jgi:hypothetical protein